MSKMRQLGLVLFTLFLWFFGISNSLLYAKEKVILDTDMVEAFDDGVAMLLLAKDPNVQLMGVTVVTGNTWVEHGTAHAIRQLEVTGLKDVPVTMGLQYPLRPNRHETFALERRLIGRGHDSWVGSFGIKQPSSWEAAYKELYGTQPTLKPSKQHAVDFIIDTVRANPNEITIAAIGPLGNLALAIRKAPDIVPLIKRIVYMGGSFFKPGNTTPAAEFNWYFDPEAARIVVRSKFREQVVLGLDVCENVVFRQEDYQRLIKSWQHKPLVEMLQNSFAGQSFTKDPKFTFFVWDVLVAAVIIDPTLITKSVEAYIDVNDQLGLSYGQSLSYPVQGPLGTQKARIVQNVDTKRFWDMLCTAQAFKKPGTSK